MRSILVLAVVTLLFVPELFAGNRGERYYTGSKPLNALDVLQSGWEVSGRTGYLISPFAGVESEGALVGARAFWNILRFDIDYLFLQSLADDDASKEKTSFLSARAGCELSLFNWLWFTPFAGGVIETSESPVGGDNGEDMGGVLGIGADLYIAPELRFSASYARHMYQDHDRLDDLEIVASASISRIFDFGDVPDMRFDVGLRGFHGPMGRIAENYLVFGLTVIF